MSNLPLITTVIPTYRRPALLRRAIRSALRQTYPFLQVCVYDNASGDETHSVVIELAKADPRVQYHCHERNIGGYANFQYGLDHVSTPFFCILADDDVLLPDFYRVAMAGFDQFPNAFGSLCGAIHVDEGGKVWLVQGTDWRSGFYPPPTGMMPLLSGQFPPPWTSFVFRREALDVTGPLDEFVGNAADYDFEFRLAALRPLVVSAEPGIIFVSHAAAESSKSRHKLTWAGWKGSAKLRTKLSEDLRISEAPRRYAVSVLNRRLYAALFRTHWLKAVIDGQWGLAKRAIVVYRTLGCRARARALGCAQRVIRAIPPARYAVRFGYRLYVALRDFRDRAGRPQYTQSIARYLEL